MKAFFLDLGTLGLFVTSIFRTLFRTTGNGPAIIEQMAYVSFRTLGTVVFAGAFVGAILVLQFQLMLEPYGASTLLGGMNTSALIREVGPLIISFLLAGKVGAFTTAELGTMRVTEQIDAVECLGHDPLRFLVIPRFVAIVLSSVVLLNLGLLVSIVGSMAVASLVFNVNYLQFMESIPLFTGPWAIFSGFFKCVVYSFIVATVSTHRGYTAKGGARGVGDAVTSAAVYTNFYIVLANTFTGMFLDAVRRFWT